jgi:hypothetical protein
MNAIVEQRIGSVRREVLDRMLSSMPTSRSSGGIDSAD